MREGVTVVPAEPSWQEPRDHVGGDLKKYKNAQERASVTQIGKDALGLRFFVFGVWIQRDGVFAICVRLV